MSPRSRRKVARKLRLVAYARVSQAREEMVSPEIQLKSIREWAAANGHVVVAEIVDPNATGRNFDRKIQDAIALVEKGEATDVCVYKFSRFGRSRRGWELNLGRLNDKSGDLHSSTEEVDATTAAGKFQRGIFKEVAAFESDRFSEQWQDAQEYRLSLGLPHTATPRFGYVHHKCNSQPVTSAGWRIVNEKDPVCRTDEKCREAYRLHPDQSRVLKELYLRYIAGEGLAPLAAWCNATSQPRERGGKWYPSSIADLLDSGFGAGLLRVGVGGTKGRPDKDDRIQYFAGAQPTVIDPDVWERYLSVRQENNAKPSSLKRSSWPLTGLVKCGLCGGNMTCAGNKHGPGYIYRCTVMQNLKACPGVWRIRAAIEDEMFRVLDEVATDLSDRARRLAPTVRRQRVVAERNVAATRNALTQAEEGKKRLVDAIMRGDIADEDVAEQMGEVNATIKRLNDTLAVDAVPPQPITPLLIRDLKTDWPTLPVSTARSMAQLLVRDIICHPDKRIEVRVVPALQLDVADEADTRGK